MLRAQHSTMKKQKGMKGPVLPSAGKPEQVKEAEMKRQAVSPQSPYFLVLLLNIYLLLIKVEGRTVSYGLCVFSTSIHGTELKRKKKQGALTFSTDQENEVSKMFILSLGN